MEEEIKAEFNNGGFALEDDEEILKKCKISTLGFFLGVITEPEYIKAMPRSKNLVHLLGVAFCINYKLKPSDIVSSWEVYYLNRFTAQSLTSHPPLV